MSTVVTFMAKTTYAILKIPNDLKTVIYCQGLHFSSTKFNVLHRFNFQITLFIYNEWN